MVGWLVLPLCSGAVGVFYSAIRQGRVCWSILEHNWTKLCSLCTIARYGYVWNGYIMFIYIYIYRTHESRNTKYNYDFLVQVRKLLLPLSLKVLRHKERDTHSFYSGFFICPTPTHHVRHLPKASASKRKSTVFSRGRSQLNSLTFSKSPKSSVRFRCVTSFALASPVSYLGYCDISEWHVRSAPARAWTPALMLHLNNPCTELKGSQPN